MAGNRTCVVTGSASGIGAATVLALAAQRRIGRPEEIASGIVYLRSPQAAFTQGANLVVDGGIVI